MSAPVRADLLALSPAALASLANMGLLKRAQKDLDAGKSPVLTVGDDGAVQASFEDGAVALLPAGRALKDAACTCGAAMVCRHRVGAVLAYQRQSPAAPPALVDAKPWSPAELDDAALERALGKGPLERARLAVRRGVVAQVRRGTFVGDDVPVVTLATSTVRFLVPKDLSHARCDCTLRTACEHVALATWAFRAAMEKEPNAATWTVELVDQSGAPAGRGFTALTQAEDLAASLVLQGAANLPEATEQGFSLAVLTLERAGLAWPLGVLQDLTDVWSAYRRRSARYSPQAWTALLLEVFARSRAGAAKNAALPARAVLGDDQALEARLDQLRLVGLGARVEADGRDRVVHIYLADAASGSVLVVQRAFTPGDEQAAPEDGAALGRRTSLGGATLAAFSVAQVVTNAATRRANRLLTFGTGPLQKTSVLPQTGALDALERAGLLVSNVRTLARELVDRPPALLRPRVLADNLRCVRVGSVLQAGWSPASQTLHAQLVDPEGNTFGLERAFSPAAAGALPTLALQLAQGVTTVVGVARHSASGVVLEPLSLGTGAALVPLDLSAAAPEGVKALDALPVLGLGPDLPPAQALLAALGSWLEGAAHNGLRNSTGPAASRLATLAMRAERLGAALLGRDAGRLVERLEAMTVTGAPADENAAVQAWVDLGLRTALMQPQ